MRESLGPNLHLTESMKSAVNFDDYKLVLLVRQLNDRARDPAFESRGKE